MSRAMKWRHGTPTGWSQHKNRGEDPCDACYAAKAAYDKRWRSSDKQTRSNRTRARAQARTNTRMKHLHPEDYQAIYVEELERAKREAGA